MRSPCKVRSCGISVLVLLSVQRAACSHNSVLGKLSLQHQRRHNSALFFANPSVGSQSGDQTTSTSVAEEIDGNSFSARKAQIQKYLQDKGIDIGQVPKAIILYEITSAGIMFGIWGLCYVLQPVQRGLIITKLAKPGAFENALAKGRNILKRSKRENVARLVTAYAEGAVLRTAIKPAIIPIKLFLTWKFQQALDGFAALTGRRAAAPAGP